MGHTPDATERQAAREATEWFLRLSEDPDDATLRRAFEEWRGASALHASVWRSTLHMSAVTRGLTPAHQAEWGSFPGPSRDVAREPRADGASAARPARGRSTAIGRLRSSRWVPVLAAAAVACAAALSAPAILLQLRSDHSTATAELRQIALADGSQVTLAPGSAIAVAYEAGERRIRLLAGEAFFDVKADPQRPFRVEARSVETSVLGTRFDVRRDEAGVTVSVEEGTVEVADASRQLPAEKLKPGQSVRVTWEGQVAKAARNPDAVAAWRRGLLLSDDEPLSSAIAQLARYYPGTIVVTDGSLAERPVTGVYRLDDPEAALRAIAQAHGARVRRLSPWLLVLSGS